MKTATVYIETICMACPECGGLAPSPNGSLYITDAEYKTLPSTLTCQSCSATFRKPVITWTRKRGHHG